MAVRVGPFHVKQQDAQMPPTQTVLQTPVTVSSIRGGPSIVGSDVPLGSTAVVGSTQPERPAQYRRDSRMGQASPPSRRRVPRETTLGEIHHQHVIRMRENADRFPVPGH